MVDQRSLRIWLPTVRAGSGSDVFTERLAAALAVAGHDPRVHWFRHSVEFLPDVLRCVKIPPGTDVVHTGSTLAHVFAGRGVPLVLTEHQYIRHPLFLPQRSWKQALYHDIVLRRFVRASLQRADAVVAVSEHTARAIEADTGLRPRVIHNWIDAEQFRPRPGYIREDDRPLRLLFVGNPSRWKGVDTIPELARRLGPTVEIRCLGGLRRDFPDMDVAGNIRRLARVTASQMPSVYAEVDAVLVPTRYEAFGYVALEAMASGLPVLGFESTGTAEICVHGETALLAPVDDLDTLERYARQLFDADLRRRLGQAGRIRAIERFAQAGAVSAYVEVYRSLLGLG